MEHKSTVCTFSLLPPPESHSQIPSPEVILVNPTVDCGCVSVHSTGICVYSSPNDNILYALYLAFFCNFLFHNIC